MNKRYTSIILLVILIGFLFIPKSQVCFAESNQDTLKIGIYDNNPLISIENNTISGLYPEIFEFITAKENWKIKYIPDSWEHNLLKLENGEIDILFAMAHSKEREDKFLFNREDVILNWGEIYSNIDQDIETIFELKEKRIGILKNDIYYVGNEGLEKLLSNFSVKSEIVIYESYEDIFDAIQAKQIDAGIVNRLFGAKRSSEYSIKQTPILFSPVHMRFGITKDHKNSDKLIKAIDYHLSILKSNPKSKYYDLISKMLSEEGSFSISTFRFILISLFIFSILLLILYLWNTNLRRLVMERTTKLEEKEKFLRAIVEDQTELIFRTDESFKFKFANETFLNLFDDIPKDYHGLEAPEKIFLSDKNNVIDKIKKLNSQDPIFSYEHMTSNNNKSIWISWLVRVLSDQKDHVSYQFVGRDITQRKKSEEALKKSEERYYKMAKIFRLIADNVPDMIWAKDLNNKYLFVNKSICQKLLIAKDTDEPIGKDDMFFADRQRKLKGNDHQWHTFGENCFNSDQIVLKSGEKQRFEEYGNVQGNFIFLDVHKAPLYDHKGELIGTVGSGRIVTKEKHMEAEKNKALHQLEEREAFNYALFQYNPIETIVVDNEGKIIKINKAIRINRSRIPNQGDLMYVDYANKHSINMREILMECIDKGQSKFLPDLCYNNKKHLAITITPIADGAIITSQDITVEKKISKQLHGLTNVFKNLKVDPNLNIQYIVEQVLEILGGKTTIYHKYSESDNLMIPVAFSNISHVNQKPSKAEDTICFTKTYKQMNQATTISDISTTDFYEQQNLLKRQNLKSYLGFPINVDGENIGTLSLYDTTIRDFTNNEIFIISTLAKTISTEEERKISRNEIQKSLKEKEILLKEIHHRVKNNMQIISSMLKLQSQQINDPEVLSLFTITQNRVRSMALIHEKLYRNTDFSRINFCDYIESLSNYLLRSYAKENSKINFLINCDEVLLDINKAIPCGLIINELITNSIKCAFNDSKIGSITIDFQENKNQFELHYSDNGSGFNDREYFNNPKTLGLQLVHALISQLHGNISLRENPGTHYEIFFPSKKDK